jgi:hypothetical protein
MNDNARRQMKKSPEAIDDRLLRLMVGNVTDRAVIGIDLEGRIFSWNAGAVKAFGRATETEGASPVSDQSKPLAGAWPVVMDDNANARALIASVLELGGARVTAFGSVPDDCYATMDSLPCAR